MQINPKFKRRSFLFLLFLSLSAFAVSTSNGTIILFSVDIASTYQIPQGLAIQIKTINSAGELIVGLILSFIALRFKYTKLLNLGLILVAISAIGCFFAPNFASFLLCSFIEGAGSVLVAVMSLALTADSFSIRSNLRIRAVSWIVASGFLFSVIIFPLTNVLAQNGGWRTIYLYITVPVALMSILFSFLSKSSTIKNIDIPLNREILLKVKQLVFTKPNSLYEVSWFLFAGTAPVGLLAIAFYRQSFTISTDFSVIIIIVVAIMSIAGSLIIEKISKKVNLKFLTTYLMAGSGISTSLLFLSQDFLIALFFNFLDAFLISGTVCSFYCLVIDQSSLYKGTIISVCRLFFGAGSVVFVAVSGYVLAVFTSISIKINYQATGVVLGVIIVTGAFILLTQAHAGSRFFKKA